MRELAFHGATVEVRLRTADERPLIAIDTSAALPNDLEIGSELWCCWDPADCHTLQRSPHE